METTNVIRIDPTKISNTKLRVLGDRVSRLWNSANYTCRQAFLQNITVPVGYKLEEAVKDTPEYKQLPSDIAQETLKKLSEAWKSYFALRKNWQEDHTQQKPGFPQYRKDKKTGDRPFDLIPIKTSRSYSIDSKDVHIVLPNDQRPNGKSGRLHIAYRGRIKHHGKMGRAEVKYNKTRKRWYFSWCVKKESPNPIESNRVAAIDLGVRILASLSIEGQEMAYHFEGREVLKDFDYIGDQIAKEQSAIANTRGKAPKKGPYSRNLSMLYAKRRNREEHALKCIAKEIAEICVQQNVGTVFIGWPKDILRNRVYNSVWAERIHNFWSFDLSSGIIANALRSVGIVAVRVGERGSSSTCPSCGSKKVTRHPRWLLKCKKCDERIHSDQAGSRNILKFNKPSISWAGLEASPRTETRRWSRHLWTSRCSDPRLQSSDDKSGLLKFLKAA